MAKHKRQRTQTRARDRPQERAQARAVGAQLTRGGWTLARASVEMASNETIYAAVMRIAGALATMPVRLYKGSDRMDADPRDHLLALRPNRRQSAYAFKSAMEIYRNTEGRAYAVKRFDAAGRLRELVPVNPALVTPLTDEVTGDVWYAVTREDRTVEYLHSWYVLSLFHASTDGLTGVRVVDVLRGTMDYAAQVAQFNLDNLKGVNHAIVLEYPTRLEGKRREESVRETLDLYRQSGGQIIALDSGVRATNLTGTAIEAASLDVDRVTRSKVATVYTLPPHMLGVTSDATASTIEQQNLEFLTLTMVPITEQWIQELDYKLLTPEERAAGWGYRFDLEAYLRADGATLATIRQGQIRSGSRTVNEIRAYDHLPPVEGGDVALVSKDLAPVALVAKGATIELDAIAGDHNAAGTQEDLEDL